MSGQAGHDKAVEIIARVLCRVAGVAEVDLDGGSNWWMFMAEAEALVSDVERRFPRPPFVAPPGEPAEHVLPSQRKSTPAPWDDFFGTRGTDSPDRHQPPMPTTFAEWAADVEKGPADQADAATRRRLTPAAVRLAVRLAQTWGLTSAEMAALLGEVYADIWANMLAGDFDGSLSEEALFRAGILLKIFRALNTIFADDLRDRWLQVPNSGPLFGGRTPIAVMVDGGLPVMIDMLRYLESWASGNV